MKRNWLLAAAGMLIILNASGKTTKDGEPDCKPKVTQVSETGSEVSNLTETYKWKITSAQGNQSSTGTTGSSTSITAGTTIGASGPGATIEGTNSNSSSESGTGGSNSTYAWVLTNSQLKNQGGPGIPKCPSPRLVGNIIGPNYGNPTNSGTKKIAAGFTIFLTTETTKPWWRIHDCNCP